MKNVSRSAKRLLAVAVVAFAALGGASAAHASDVLWSVGVASPGVQLGLSNAPAVIMPRTVYRRGYPVVAPAPVVYLRPAPVVYRTYVEPPWVQPVYYERGHGRYWEHHQRHPHGPYGHDGRWG